MCTRYIYARPHLLVFYTCNMLTVSVTWPATPGHHRLVILPYCRCCFIFFFSFFWEASLQFHVLFFFLLLHLLPRLCSLSSLPPHPPRTHVDTWQCDCRINTCIAMRLSLACAASWIYASPVSSHFQVIIINVVPTILSDQCLPRRSLHCTVKSEADVHDRTINRSVSKD